MILAEVLHAHIPTLTEQSTVRDAVDKMDIYQFPALVVVDNESRPKAVLTEGDLCRAAHRNGTLVGISEDPAYVYASSEPTCAPSNMEISDAYHLMLSSGLTILPVVTDGVLDGIVLRMDLMQAILMDYQPKRKTSGSGK